MKKGGLLIAGNIKFEEEMGQSSANFMIYSLIHHGYQANISLPQHYESTEGMFKAFFIADIKGEVCNFYITSSSKLNCNLCLIGPAGPDLTLTQPMVSVCYRTMFVSQRKEGERLKFV